MLSFHILIQINMNLTLAKPLDYLRYSLGIIYLWFGLLKFFPGFSPAESLVMKTVDMLSFHQMSGKIGLTLIAVWEVTLGFCFMINQCKKPVLILYFIHILGTFTPLFILPDISFQYPPVGFTLVGQYIVKNLVFVVGGWMLWKKNEWQMSLGHNE